MKKKILILGGTGFLGYHLAKKCLDLKWIVYSVSKKKPKKARFLKNVQYFYFDLSKKENLNKLKKNSFDHVINLSGYVEHKNISLINKGHYNSVKNLFYYFQKKNIKSFIQVGSSAEYGNLKAPHLESKLDHAQGNYGKVKLKSTKFLLKKKSFPATILRFYQVYGPYQDSNRFISQLIISSLKKRSFSTSFGIQCRDFLYVTDAVHAIIKLIKCKKNIKGQIINIGFGKCVKLKKIMELVKKETKFFQPIYGQITLRKDELLQNYPSIKKAKKILNWYPKISLKNGIKKTISYYKKSLRKNK